MTTLNFNSVERDMYKQAGRDAAKERIENVQKAILNYGVDPKYLFKLEDVLEKKNTPKVVRCLEEVAKIVSLIFRILLNLSYEIYSHSQK